MRRATLYRLLIVPVLLMASLLPCRSQQDTTRRIQSLSDSSAFARGGDTVPQEFVMSKSPTMAILYSIVPGGGQLYNHDYWKIPLFFGAATFFAVRVVYYHSLFLERADQVDALELNDPTRGRLRTQREFYRDNRDLNVAYFLGVEILNMVDAYVGAHLFDFNVDDDLSSRIYFDPVRNGVGLALQW